MAEKEMHLPYYERRAYCSYKQIKVLQPQLDTPIEEYINIKIEEQERKLVGGALSLKRTLKAIDQLPHNGIMNDMIKLTHRNNKQKTGAQSTSAAPLGGGSDRNAQSAHAFAVGGWATGSNS